MNITLRFFFILNDYMHYLNFVILLKKKKKKKKKIIIIIIVFKLKNNHKIEY